MVKFLESKRKDINKIIYIQFIVEEQGIVKYLIQDHEGNTQEIKSKGNGLNEYRLHFEGPQDRNYFVITIGKFDKLENMTPLFAENPVVYRNLTDDVLEYNQVKDLTIKSIVYCDTEITYRYDV
jgi:hypothetical protein